MRKVSTQERLPKEQGRYLVWKEDGTRELKWFYPLALSHHQQQWIEDKITHWLDESADSAPVDVMRLAEDITQSAASAVTCFVEQYAHGSTHADRNKSIEVEVNRAAAKIEALARKREEEIVEAYRLFRNDIEGADAMSHVITTKEWLDKFREGAK